MGGDVPKHTRDVFAGLQQEPADILIRSPVDGSRDEEVFHCRRWSAMSCELESPRVRHGPASFCRRRLQPMKGVLKNSGTYSCRPAAERPGRLAVGFVELRWRA